MALFETLPVDRKDVERIVASHWGLALESLLKASQNHTFAARDPVASAAYAVRVTPDPRHEASQRIADELDFVHFLAEHLDGVCAPVPAKAAAHSQLLVREGDLIVCVFRWAEGVAPNFGAYEWLQDAALVRAWGAWFARLHELSRRYRAEFPHTAARFRPWDQVHQRVLAGAAIHPADAGATSDLACFGILHGDLNISNFFVREDGDASHRRPRLSVYDWDQVQLGWFEFDLAQAMLTSVMLAEAGAVVTGEPVPQADPAKFERWLVEGYEGVAGPGSVNRDRLARMLALRKLFYARFCVRAQQEGVPSEMAAFIDYIVRWVGPLVRSPSAES